MTLFLEFWPYLAAAGAALIAFWRVYAMGQNSIKAKQAKKELAAAKDRLEMDREATAAERQATGMTDAEARSQADRVLSRPSPSLVAGRQAVVAALPTLTKDDRSGSPKAHQR